MKNKKLHNLLHTKTYTNPSITVLSGSTLNEIFGGFEAPCPNLVTCCRLNATPCEGKYGSDLTLPLEKVATKPITL